MKNYLKRFAEEVPSWMLNHSKGEKINLNDVLRSRIVYYPGAGMDGQPVHTFAQAHAAHVFMYVDYELSQKEIHDELSQNGFKGYQIFEQIKLNMEDLTPSGWNPHIHPDQKQIKLMHSYSSGESYAFLVIFERDTNFGEEHGPRRFAILFVGGDGIATYDAVFCNRNAAEPFCVVLQDHGSGGNWDCFGKGGMMEKAAGNSGVYPQYILATTVDSTEVWKGYARIPDAPSVLGGMHHVKRELFERI